MSVLNYNRSVPLSTIVRRWVRKNAAHELRRRRDRLAERAALKAQIERCREGAIVHVYRSSTDCDLYEHCRVERWPAHPVAVERLTEYVLENAEGRELFEIIPAAEARTIAEAYIDHAAEKAGY